MRIPAAASGKRLTTPDCLRERDGAGEKEAPHHAPRAAGRDDRGVADDVSDPSERTTAERRAGTIQGKGLSPSWQTAVQDSSVSPTCAAVIETLA